jgi:hypothetical protein
LYGDYKPAIVDSDTYPHYWYEIIPDPYPPYYEDTIYHEQYLCSEPKIHYASREIITKSHVTENGGLECYAGSVIRLLPNFKVNSGGCFKTVIDPSMEVDLYYEETTVNTCTGGYFNTMFNSKKHDLVEGGSDLQYKYSLSNDKGNRISNQDINNKDNYDTDVLKVDKSSQIDNTLAKVYLNPSSGKFTFSSDFNIESIYVVDLCGQIILKTDDINNRTQTFSLAGYPDGIYHLQVLSNSNIYSFKIIKM